ncbi:discoidin domain-containing protein, partial [Geoalkalibacter sp.]|uniref:discoidin domain-containing protein n=1 Tax=Geoalkalibacter sp. TaxID=3041440 RepID=UPI00272EE3A0
HVGANGASLNCSSCHFAPGSPQAGQRHHATPAYQMGQCLHCHTGAEPAKISCALCHTRPNHHGQPAAISGNCQHCHTGIQTRGDSCQTCHTAPIAQIHHGEPLASLGGNCAVCHEAASSPSSCASCHSSNPHHGTMQSQTGNCTHCHKVPPSSQDRPQQAACRECHGRYMHDKGGPIQNYGACAACHDTKPYHAAPRSIPGYTGPGAGKNKFNMFWSMFAIKEGPGKKLRPNGEDMKDKGGFKIAARTIPFNVATIEYGGKAYLVPHFDNGNNLGNLAACTSCHGFRGDKVKCGSTKWTDHLSRNRVDLATYRLAEAVYLGSLCGDGGIIAPPPGSGDLTKCTSCHGNRSDRVRCDNNKWREHLSRNRVDQATYELAEKTYIGYLCSTGPTPPPPGPDPISANLALKKTVTATHQESAYPAALAVDGNLGTRWWGKRDRDVRLQVDLGMNHRISRVVIDWHSLYAREYEILVSTNGRDWTRVLHAKDARGGRESRTFSARDARYVQIYCRQANQRDGFSINEFEVYAQ